MAEINLSKVPELYVPCGTYPYCENQRDFIENYRGSDVLERDDFWIGYMVVAYQATDSTSVDPQGFVGGYAPLRNESILPLQDVYNNRFGITPGGIGDIIFIETMRDYDLLSPPLLPGEKDFTLARTRVAPHELGHQFGLAHEESLTGSSGLMSYTGSLYFVPHHINYMRWRIHSPGEPR